MALLRNKLTVCLNRKTKRVPSVKQIHQVVVAPGISITIM